MESVLPEKRCVVDGKASQQQEELSSPTKEKLQDDPDRPSMSAKENGTEEEQENEGVEHEEEEDGDSCANSMAHTEKSIGQMNGDADDTDLNVSPKNAVKSPSANRTGRKNQEVKDRSSFICPLCDKNCQTQHYLTMHIRQHNTETGGSDHSCSICGKALSSASSLDRHMLVHSGERPYKCSVCGQTFTTNGNMHRHMKIHDKGPNGIPASRPVSPNKRRKPTKRKLSVEDGVEKTNEPPNKKVFVGRESGKQSPAKHEEDLLHCPICFKTFICKYGLESHMESHPDTALRCNLCCITFRTHRSLLRHNSVIHKQLPTDPNGRPFIQSNPSIPLGFSDLSFIDFSCSKFPQIAQVWCETNLRRCSSKFHRFICEVCNKAFPLQVSLDLHMNSHKDNAAEPQKQQNDTILYTAKDSEDSKEIVESAPQDASVTLNGKNDFMKCLGLQHSSLVKPEESEAEKQQKILNSIRFIRVEPSATNLPQESNSSLGLCLLDPVSLQGLNKSNGLSLLSLQSLQGGLVVRPVSQTGVELADIQQILKMAQITIPSQMTLPLLPKSAEGPLQAEPKQITPLKPKPLVTPRSSMGTSTPSPPVMNAQQASSGCISPSLPPPAAEILTSKQSSNTPSSSTSSSPTNWENTHLVGDGIGATIMTIGDIKQEGLQGKDLRTSGGKKIPKTEYKCRFCTQVFSFPGGLQAHMRAHHYGSSPYKCSICTYTAPDNATLIRHLRTHSGERPYVCRICHYPFTVKANCERHLRKKHMKNTRKEIEKNIEYITTSSSASSVGITQDFVDVANIGNTSCRYCGEDLKTYRALQIHLRTLNGCQRKPFECRQCGAAFLAKRNCIHHLLKQHPEVQEREIEDHINTLVPVTAPSSVQINSPAQSHSGKQNLNTFSETAVQDQPLDFSSKTMKTIHSDVKPAPASPSLLNNSSLEPIDLSIRKILEGKKIKTEQVDTTSLNHQEAKKEVHSSTGKILGTVLGVHASLPASMPSLANTPTNDITKPPIRLKPLLPKPVAAFKTSEMPPLASIAQIISSVSAAPVLIKTGISSEKSDGVVRDETLIDKKGFSGTATPGSSFSCPSLGASKRKGKKRPFKDEICDSAHASISGIDLESCGELPSVEKMLATTDANKFSSYLQLRQMEPEKEQQSASEEEKEGKEDKEKARPQGKGKKNAYSNSVQKMRCPYCPRVFPWTSSLQRHMLTHTGQKPFPCPQCDALFSTKSNCERHLLRKHGLSSRNTLQNTGSHPKTRVDEGSQGSTDGVSDGEPTVMLHDVDPIKEHKIITDDMDLTEQANNINTELSELEKVPESAQPFEEVHINPNENDDSESKKSVDLNVATEPTEHKMAETEQEPPKVAEPERASSKEFPHTCSVCKKTFRHGTTLSRHQKIHLQDNQNDDGIRKEKDQRTLSSKPLDTSTLPLKEAEQGTGEAEKEENSSVVESDAEEEEKDGQKDDRNEEEDGCSSELDSPGCRPDKRKKICNVCSKRFWSLQDLTRHMRSHTGERPYQCQTCDRTFTLKHSLVRHQRIHQKNPDDRGTDETDGARDDSAVDGEDLRCSSGSESETLAENETGNSNQTEEAIEKVDESVVKEEKESTAEASKKPQTEELAKLDAKAPEPKDATAPSLKDKQTC